MYNGIPLYIKGLSSNSVIDKTTMYTKWGSHSYIVKGIILNLGKEVGGGGYLTGSQMEAIAYVIAFLCVLIRGNIAMILLAGLVHSFCIKMS